MSNIAIIDSLGKDYVSEFMDDLPDNVYLCKSLTGCGATTLAIENSVNYVICVPFISLIHNKCSQHINLLGVYGDVYDEEIEEYLANEDVAVKKFMVTYDSLARLMKFIDVNKYKLLIDEAHKLLDSASFRNKAVETVLENYSKFNSYVFCTATPVREKYQLPILKDIPRVTIKWYDVLPVNVMHQRYDDKLNQRIAVLIIRYLKNEIEGNPYFFINSVNSIVSILRYLRKAGYNNPMDYRIICADNDQNRRTFNNNGLVDYEILDSTSSNRKITFITSAGFEGSDYRDVDGVTYIITDGKKDHTKYDILTQMIQIIGRLRDSKYKNNVNIIYTPHSYFSYTSVDEYEAEVRKQLERYKVTVANFSNYDEITQEKLLESASRDAYLAIKDNKLVLNENVMYCEMNNYEIINSNHYVKAKDTKIINDVKYNFSKIASEIELNAHSKMRLAMKPNFKTLCIEYHKAKLENNVEVIKEIELHYVWIKEAYDKLGFDKLQALEFVQKDIDTQLAINNSYKSQEAKIVNLLGYRVGQLLDRSEVKSKLQDIYDSLNIEKTAKASDLLQWFSIKPHNKRVDGKTISKLKIITCNIKM